MEITSKCLLYDLMSDFLAVENKEQKTDRTENSIHIGKDSM
jgi:hypothetical protein